MLKHIKNLLSAQKVLSAQKEDEDEDEKEEKEEENLLNAGNNYGGNSGSSCCASPQPSKMKKKSTPLSEMRHRPKRSREEKRATHPKKNFEEIKVISTHIMSWLLEKVREKTCHTPQHKSGRNLAIFYI